MSSAGGLREALAGESRRAKEGPTSDDGFALYRDLTDGRGWLLIVVILWAWGRQCAPERGFTSISTRRFTFFLMAFTRSHAQEAFGCLLGRGVASGERAQRQHHITAHIIG